MPKSFFAFSFVRLPILHAEGSDTARLISSVRAPLPLVSFAFFLYKRNRLTREVEVDEE